MLSFLLFISSLARSLTVSSFSLSGSLRNLLNVLTTFCEPLLLEEEDDDDDEEEEDVLVLVASSSSSVFVMTTTT